MWRTFCTVYLYSYLFGALDDFCHPFTAANRLSELVGGMLFLKVAFDQRVCACTRWRSRSKADSERKHEVTGL